MLTVPKDKLSAVDEERLERWREVEVHWANIDALRESVEAVMADKVIDQAESRDLCFKAAQWRTQLEAAQEYMARYRRVEPTLVANTPRIHLLKPESERTLKVVAGLEAECQ